MKPASVLPGALLALLPSGDCSPRWPEGDAIAADLPYVSLWCKVNAVVYLPDLETVRLSPVAALTFLRDVVRRPL